MKKSLHLITLAFLSVFNVAWAQEGATHIAIIPFTPSTPKAKTTTSIVQEEVTSCFVNKDRFYLLDRGVTEKLKKELETAKDNSSIYAKVVAEQGHLAGAEYIITGSVDSVIYSGNTSKDLLSTNVKQSLDTKATYSKFHGTVHLVLQINKVETGKVIFSKPFLVTSRDFDDYSESAILENALCRLKNQLKTEVRSLFPPVMTIVSVDKEKKGLPDKVLVNGGSEIFDSGKQESDCPGDDGISVASKTSAVGSVFSKMKGAIVGKKILLSVVCPEIISAGGKNYTRDKVIAQLKIDSVEGELTLCSVLKGAQDIKSYLDDKKTLFVRLEKED
jgi:hypothetical protein